MKMTWGVRYKATEEDFEYETIFDNYKESQEFFLEATKNNDFVWWVLYNGDADHPEHVFCTYVNDWHYSAEITPE